MNTLTFLNSPLLWGLSLASIPVIIHLLYRRQYRRVDWAPMHYLKLSIQRNRRRIRTPKAFRAGWGQAAGPIASSCSTTR